MFYEHDTWFRSESHVGSNRKKVTARKWSFSLFLNLQKTRMIATITVLTDINIAAVAGDNTIP